MEKNRTLAGLSKYIRHSPEWYYFIVPAFILLLIDYLILGNAYFVAIVLLPSYILLNFLDYIFIKISRSQFPVYRLIYFDFASFFISNLFFYAAYLLNFVIGINILYMTMLAISFAAFFRFLILYIYFPNRTLSLVISSMSYTFSFIIISLIFYYKYLKVVYFIPFIISSLIYVAFAIFFIRFSTSNFYKRYKSKPAELINFFISRSQIGAVADNFFSKVYNKIREIPVKTVDIRSNGKTKVLMVFPYVHPGPYGNLCSSNLPYKLSAELGLENIMVFHTATTNSNNCCGKEDIKNIAGAVKSSLKKINYSSKISKIEKLRIDGYSMSMFRFGNYGLSAIIPDEKKFDDISLKEGLKLIKAMKNVSEDFAVIDAQNCFTRNAPELNDLSMFLNSAQRLFKSMETKYDAMIGFASVKSNIESLGPLGIQAITLKTDNYQSIVLTDSNNITEEAMNLVRSKFDFDVEIYTTDNHLANASNLDVNPLGAKDPQQVADAIAEAVKKSINDIEPVEMGMGTSYVKVRMGEENSFQILINTVISSLKRAKYSIAVVLLLSIITSILAFKYLMFFMLLL
ncbi:DUF2070 family protein [Picrophilus oshimae]|uniref:Hypothetical membrane spanning protein n=1 Tax=Picrophilus torridus (strain ATCC 700027 / DSM 9790 / JCM 10055 / NBRC 100828 / KAW 2/3) TaxID=1122961 RepID=Q6L2E4_PICTO|nr:DUF2070 family protein [Picrophilus oshimae]AAT42858.1 hypothetical membrane spanning protein [Picrophilus oshimae DSM 9789]